MLLEVYSSRVFVRSFSRSLPSPHVPRWSCRAGQLHVMNHLFLFPSDVYSHQPGLLGWDLLQSRLEEPLTEVEPCWLDGRLTRSRPWDCWVGAQGAAGSRNARRADCDYPLRLPEEIHPSCALRGCVTCCVTAGLRGPRCLQ